MRRSIVETLLGGLVLAVAAVFLVVALNTAEVGSERGGYPVTARFLSIGGLEVGSDVRISGVKVGAVVDRRLDLKAYEAVVTLSLAPGVELPADTVAIITSDGLIGGKYLRLVPGSAAERIPPGGAIVNVRDYKALEDTVSEIIFLATGGDK
ncbi:MAG: MlaD family protein [Alphaproteobacteria bacterium]